MTFINFIPDSYKLYFYKGKNVWSNGSWNIHHSVLIRFYPRKWGWPDLSHPNSNLSNSHSPSRSIQGILLLQTNTCFLLHLHLPRLLWSSSLPLALHFKLQCFSQNILITLHLTLYDLTPFAFAILMMWNQRLSRKIQEKMVHYLICLPINILKMFTIKIQYYHFPKQSMSKRKQDSNERLRFVMQAKPPILTDRWNLLSWKSVRLISRIRSEKSGIKTYIIRRVATCKPGKPGLTSFTETLALFFIQFLSFRKMKIQDRQNGPSKSFCYVTFLLCLGSWWSRLIR